MARKIEMPAGLMFGALTESGIEFDLHSGKDSVSLPGKAVVTVDADGAPIKIKWRAGQ